MKICFILFRTHIADLILKMLSCECKYNDRTLSFWARKISCEVFNSFLIKYYYKLLYTIIFDYSNSIGFIYIHYNNIQKYLEKY